MSTGIMDQALNYLADTGATTLVNGTDTAGVYMTQIGKAFLVSFREYNVASAGAEFNTGLTGLTANTISVGLHVNGSIIKIVCNAKANGGLGKIVFTNAAGTDFPTGKVSGQILIA